MGAFTNYTNTDLKVLSVHPNISSANVRFLGTFLLSSCEPLSHAPAIYEPRNRWSSPTYLPKATTMAPTAVAVLPRSPSGTSGCHGTAGGWAVRCTVLCSRIGSGIESRHPPLGNIFDPGIHSHLRAGRECLDGEYPGPRFLFAFGVGHASSAKSR